MEAPLCFEAGTPNIAGAVALGAALDYMEGFGRDLLRRHEIELTEYALKALGEVGGVTLYGPADATARAGSISFSMRGIHPHDVAQVLDSEGVAVRGGHHCCQLLMRQLDERAVVRASLVPSNVRR